MSDKRENLRRGDPVELKPGVHGRLNFEDQTLELSDGKKLAISEKNKRDLFPANKEAHKYAQEREKIKKGIKESPFGEFGEQFSNSGIIGGIKDLGSRYLSGRSKEEYNRYKSAQQEIGQEISEESPWTSRAATAASFVPDLLATRGLSATAAAPVITGLSAGSRVFDEPMEVAKEAGASALGGYFIEKGAKGLQAIAARRGEIRALPGQQQAVRAQNVAGKQANDAANLQQNQAFNVLDNSIKTKNADILKAHTSDLEARKNRMIQAANAEKSANAARDAQIVQNKNVDATNRAAYQAEVNRLKQEATRLSEEYKLAKNQYEDSLKNLPTLQKQAQAEYSQGVVKNAQALENYFPKESKIFLDDVGTSQFINDNIIKNGLASSKEGGQAGNILKSLFTEGETLSGRELSKRYQALETAIQRSSPKVQGILTDFKNHLGERIPTMLEDSIAYHKVMPSLTRDVEKDIGSVFSKIPGATPKAMEAIKSNAKETLQGIDGRNFVQNLQSGQISEELLEKIAGIEHFLPDWMTPANAAKIMKSGKSNVAIENAKRNQQDFISQLSQKINNNMAQYELKAAVAGKDASNKIGRKLQGTLGMAQPVEPPIAPAQPNLNLGQPVAPSPTPLPPPIASPQIPSIPQRPPLLPTPSAPISQPFNPAPEPTLPAASGVAGTAGDLLEKNILGGRGLVNNPLTKLAGLKYALGGAALPAEAAYLGMKGLTSPTAGGEVARMAFRQGGIEAVNSWAQKYPSYQNGILESPQDRRSLTKEIEDDQEIPLEQKAIIQSKVNRGKPLSSPQAPPAI